MRKGDKGSKSNHSTINKGSSAREFLEEQMNKNTQDRDANAKNILKNTPLPI